ncbi:hypothetical protein AK830_g8100 [Neonectria ditissima]|uniref:Trichodiene oxygenase n=1 Tax=Neonectria ditissima TaxID=78410 RepID=A0A0P7BDF3_9HYPO|nr:hypothetical protein AK830_g8100 [Neonectria ditissima]
MALILLASAALLFVLVLQIAKKFVQAHVSPLSQIPSAGFAAPYSRLLWAFRREYRGTITLDLPVLHKKLGPLIRIGPNEVSFYSMEVYDAVHKVNSGYKKDPRVYGNFVQDGHPALFSITAMGLKHGVIELMSACRALEADIISSFSFGKSINAVDSWARRENLNMVAKNDEKATWMPLLTSFPVAYEIWEQLEDFFYKKTNLRTSYSHGLSDFDMWSEEAWRAAMGFEKFAQPLFPNLIHVMASSGLPPETALSEAKENLGPGTDTTSGSLAHIMYALGCNRSFQESLYEDLQQVAFSTEMSTLENIPRLRACVKEGIRWAGTAAAMLPRIAPIGGVELLGKHIPEGTVLTSSPIWYLRDEDAFPGPELFDPYRWINDDGLTFKEDPVRDQYYIPFSKGANVCIGLHFSYYELYLGISQMIRSFRVRSRSGELGSTSGAPHNDWHPVLLPARKEWVAAVLTGNLDVQLEAR